MKYKLFTGKDHFNNKPLYRVHGIDNEYVGEWHTSIEDANKELIELETE